MEERIKASEIARSNASGFEPGVSQQNFREQRGHLTRIIVDTPRYISKINVIACTSCLDSVIDCIGIDFRICILGP